MEDLRKASKSIATQIPSNPAELREALKDVQRQIRSLKHELKVRHCNQIKNAMKLIETYFLF